MERRGPNSLELRSGAVAPAITRADISPVISPKAGLLLDHRGRLPVELVTEHVYERSTTAVDINTTTTEKSLYDGSTAGATTGWTVGGNVLGTNKTYRLTLLGDYLFNNAGADTLTVKVKLNNIVLWQGTPINAPGSQGPNRHPFFFQLHLTNLASTSAQNLTALFTSETVAAAAPTTGRGIVTTPLAGTLGGSGTVDTTISQKFDVTVTWSASSANNSFKVITALSELL